MLGKAYDDSLLSKTQTYECYKAFKGDREIVKDMPRSRRPSISSTDESIKKVNDIILQNRQVSVRQMPKELGISRDSVRIILGLIRDLALLVPIKLKEEYHKRVSLDKFDRANSNPTFVGSILTADKTRVYETCKKVNNYQNGDKKNKPSSKNDAKVAQKLRGQAVNKEFHIEAFA
ncbi:PREDICTED: uncharacterized protein LOC108969273 [Bactrocera latifrons]|uniref:uncharacterized protein LOC108969273 n=1 Tax=Bactrocera latifrons TaxID=174628 RepID=UPI0008DD1956|nr:PREDICTED: uncharacterized protein LOC108969273 [Bactrocera latifrons]